MMEPVTTVRITNVDARTAAWERLCDNARGCHTRCCYFEDSPCEHLLFEDEARERGRCRIYADRFGVHQTVDGRVFRCVPMTTKLKAEGAPHPLCGYAAIRAIDGVPVVVGQR